MDTQWILNLFGIIGIVIAVVVLVIAMVWLVCFVVRLLVKTFGVKVKSSYEIMVEDITKKAKAKKARNEKKRNAKNLEKQELLDMKLASNHKVFLMKRQKLQKELEAKENEEKQKHLGDDVFFEEAQEKLYQTNQSRREEEMKFENFDEDAQDKHDDELKQEDNNIEIQSKTQNNNSEEVVEKSEEKEQLKANKQEIKNNSSNLKSQKSHSFNQGIDIIDALAKEEKESTKVEEKK